MLASLVLGVFAVALAIGLAACGSSSSSSSTSSGSSTESSSGGSDAAGIAAAKKLITEYTQPPRWEGPTEAIDTSSLKGKVAVFIGADFGIPFNKEMSEFFSEAAEAMGMKPIVIDGKGSPEAAAAGIRRAITLHAAAIGLLSVSPETVGAAAKEAQAQGIPLISSANWSTGVEIPSEIGANVTVDYQRVGELQAAYAVDASEGDVDGVGFYLPQFPADKSQGEGQEKGMEKFCPSCTFKQETLLLSNFQQVLPAKVRTLVQTEPELNWLMPSFDGLNTYIVPAVTQVGAASRVQSSSHNAVSENLEFIRNEEVQSMSVGENTRWWAFAMLDDMARLTLGKPAVEENIPLRVFDKEVLEELGEEPSQSELFDNVDYEGEYQKLWSGE